MIIYSGFTHKKWWFSTAMLVYQRVMNHWIQGYPTFVELPSRAAHAEQTHVEHRHWPTRKKWISPEIYEKAMTNQTGWWFEPLWKIWLSAGMMKFPTEWKVIIQMFQTTKQQTSLSFISFSVHPIPGQKLTQKSSTNFGPRLWTQIQWVRFKVSHDYRAYVPTQL